jgi:hypothetical protein
MTPAPGRTPAAKQFVEKLTIRIMVSLQRYVKGFRISLGFSRWRLLDHEMSFSVNCKAG